MCSSLWLLALTASQGAAQPEAPAVDQDANHEAQESGEAAGAAPPAPTAALPEGRRTDAVQVPEEEARDAVLRATARFEQGDFARAALEFERAYRLLPPGAKRHAVLNNLAVCHQRMHHHVEALELFQRYLREADPLPADRAEVLRIVEGLRDLTGELEIVSNVTAEVWVDDGKRGATPLRLRLSAGRHVLELRAEGYEAHRTAVTVEPRAVQPLQIELKEREVYRGAPRVYFLTGLSVTGATLLTATALGARSVRLQRDAQDHLELATVEDEAKIHRMAIATDITLAASAMFGVATLVLGFLTDFERAPQPTERGALHVGWAVSRGGAGLAVAGSY